MEFKVFKACVLSNNIPKFLVFIQKEYMLVKQYLQHISKSLNKDLDFYNSIDEAIYALQTNIMQDKIYIIYNDANILKNDEYIKSIIDSNKYVFLIYDDLDKNTNLYKNFESNLVIFNKLDKYQILAYIQSKLKQEKISISQDKLLQLIDYCNCDFSIVLNELDKIIILNQENSSLLVDYMLKNEFPDYREQNIFIFINKLLNKNISVINDIYNMVDNSVIVLYNIFMCAKKKFVDTKNNQLLKIMKLAYNLYIDILEKRIDERYALKYLLLEIFDA